LTLLPVGRTIIARHLTQRYGVSAMNKMVSTVEFEQDVATAITPMTRREKLLRFARVVRESSKQFVIFHMLEHAHPSTLAGVSHPHSAFAAAAADPILKDAGLAGDSVADAMKFFELSQAELHEFSCNCGGVISNSEMASRIEKLAEGPKVGFFQGIANRF
jgi:hypothetical protein